MGDSVVIKKKKSGSHLSIQVKVHEDGTEERLRVIRLRGMPISEKPKAIVIHTLHSKDRTIKHIDVKIDGFKVYLERYKDGKLTTMEEVGT